MKSLILSLAARALSPLLLMFSIFVLMRGHNEPGGGFIGGLTASAAFSLVMLAYGPGRVRQVLRLPPLVFIVAGLSLAFLSGLAGPVVGLPFLTGIWPGITLPVIGTLGSPVVFDIGVYLTVVGVVMLIILTLAED